jgi:FtsH-binding integral membrane protein
MKMSEFEYDPKLDMYVEVDVANRFILKTFKWMFVGIFITALPIIAAILDRSILIFLVRNSYIPMMSSFAALFIGMFIRNNSLSLERTKLMFVTYSFLQGIALSFLALYNTRLLLSVTATTVVLFSILAVYGYFTKDDLTNIGNYLAIALLLLIVMSILNIFTSNRFDMVLGYLGAIIFLGFIAYEVNKIKHMSGYISNRYSSVEIEKYAIYGAFSLYLSFINLFLSILKILSKNDKSNNKR